MVQSDDLGVEIGISRGAFQLNPHYDATEHQLILWKTKDKMSQVKVKIEVEVKVNIKMK